MHKRNKQETLTETEVGRRQDLRNELLLKLQASLGKTRDQLLKLFRHYNKLSKKS